MPNCETFVNAHTILVKLTAILLITERKGNREVC